MEYAPTSVAVFCGASDSVSVEYKTAARATGALLATLGVEIVYGGASVGLMGELANAAIAAGGRVVGVIPEFMVEREIAHRGLHELVVVPGMHSRKAKMVELAGAFLALPGGLGTLDELFEITTWAELGLHPRRIGLLNVAGFFDPLLAFVAHAESEGFIKPKHRALWVTSHDAAELCRELLAAPA
jgi:uncharacterized protein (TIGR00730 family)